MRTPVLTRLVSALAIGCASAPSSAPPAAPRHAADTRSPADSAPTVLTPAQAARDRAIAARVAPIVDAFTSSAPLLLRDGRVVFESTRDGLPALYIADTREPSAPPRKLPAPPERVSGAVLLPDERAVLFMSDVKADRNFRIYRVDVDGGGAPVLLTPSESLHRTRPHVARRVPGLFSYAAHAVSDPTARVFVQRSDGAPPLEVYRDPQSGNVLDMAPDGKGILFNQWHSQSEQVLLEIDAATGKARRVYPAEGATAEVSAAAYSADGRRILVASAAEGAAPALAAIDRRSGRATARYREQAVPTGTIVGLEVSPTGDAVAIAIDAGNRSEVRILDGRSLRLRRTVDAGVGEASPGPFRADGARFGLELTTPDAPTDIHAVTTRTGQVAPLRADARPGIAGAQRVASSIVSVRAFDGLDIPVNLYLPAGATGKLPTVVLVHGGPSGSAYASYHPEVRLLASMGYAVVQPNIRGSTGFGQAYEKADDREKRGDALRDIATINAWARAQPWCDGRLVIMGTSYGGYMVLLALTRQPTLWQAGVDNSGMSDLQTMEKLEDQTIRVYDETEFGALGRDDALLAEWSPLRDMSAVRAPVFIYQGANDPVTPREQADRMVRALRERAVPVEYMLITDEGHGVIRRENRIAYLARVVRFLREHLGARGRGAAAHPPG